MLEMVLITFTGGVLCDVEEQLLLLRCLLEGTFNDVQARRGGHLLSHTESCHPGTTHQPINKPGTSSLIFTRMG